ncbi:flavin-dependent oxidoreductase [Paracoccus sp. S-4012]|uniref:flavin-dependent oxidoreductase n=1 Tax=Paracoccus sp. S-4012 TaxID=2665648 RepID=UPI0012B03322|nr:flavin-dependent oxidoreductase [Paracoccus sp. S-4012]MRX52282.1 flavin-dependent oxidoreductase [Paracoccus sp. S-4012]
MHVLIAGGGVGGLTTALMLHRAGIGCTILEQVPSLRELGVGITLMPSAIKELASLGFLPTMETEAIATQHLHYRTRGGLPVWDEPRGVAAGQPVPQFFVHRGRLQGMLARAVEERCPEALRLGHRVQAVAQDAATVTVTAAGPDGEVRLTGDALIGADGIHSTVRRLLHPAEGDPRYSGLMMWRGATSWPEYLGGSALLIQGGVDAKFVAYPIAPGARPGERLTNWVVIVRMAPDGSPPPERADWSRPARRPQLEAELPRFASTEIDLPALVAATEEIWEYPMFDRDPAPFWSQGRVTLLGDAAHPMYPMGANGGTQAILDARALTDALAAGANIPRALTAYEAERLPKTAAIVLSNRQGGPEGVIDAVEARAPDGYQDVDAVMSREERAAFMGRYAELAGFSVEQVRAR